AALHIPEGDHAASPPRGQGLAVGAEGQRVRQVVFPTLLFLPRGWVPQPQRLIVAGGGQGPAVGAERERVNPPTVAFEPPPFLAGSHLPEPDRVVIVPAGGS